MSDITGGVRVIRHTAPPAFNLSLLSDLHIGSATCDEAAIRRDIATAKRNEDRILLNGDLFDAIIAGDKRYSPSSISPRFAGRDDLIDAVVTHAAELLSPVAHLIDFIGTGNHEATILRRGGTQLIQRLADALNRPHVTAGAAAFIEYRIPATRSRFLLYAHHGAGSGSGAGIFNKYQWLDCDMVWIGHHHVKRVEEKQVTTLDAKGRIVHRSIRYLATGAYLRPYEATDKPIDNYVTAQGYTPHGIGGVRVLLDASTKRLDIAIVQ